MRIPCFTVESYQCKLMEILTVYKLVVRIEKLDVRTMPDKSCGRKALGMEGNLHSVFDLQTMRCIVAPAVYLDVRNYTHRLVFYVAYLLGDSRDIILVYRLFFLFHGNIGHYAMLTRKADICVSYTVGKSHDYLNGLKLILYPKENMIGKLNGFKHIIHSLGINQRFLVLLFLVRNNFLFNLSRAYTLRLSVKTNLGILEIEHFLHLFIFMRTAVECIENDNRWNTFFLRILLIGGGTEA